MISWADFVSSIVLIGLLIGGTLILMGILIECLGNIRMNIVQAGGVIAGISVLFGLISAIIGIAAVMI